MFKDTSKPFSLVPAYIVSFRATNGVQNSYFGSPNSRIWVSLQKRAGFWSSAYCDRQGSVLSFPVRGTPSLAHRFGMSTTSASWAEGLWSQPLAKGQVASQSPWTVFITHSPVKHTAYLILARIFFFFFNTYRLKSHLLLKYLQSLSNSLAVQLRTMCVCVLCSVSPVLCLISVQAGTESGAWHGSIC